MYIRFSIFVITQIFRIAIPIAQFTKDKFDWNILYTYHIFDSIVFLGLSLYSYIREGFNFWFIACMVIALINAAAATTYRGIKVARTQPVPFTVIDVFFVNLVVIFILLSLLSLDFANAILMAGLNVSIALNHLPDFPRREKKQKVKALKPAFQF